jgi:hypothetical protein
VLRIIKLRKYPVTISDTNPEFTCFVQSEIEKKQVWKSGKVFGAAQLRATLLPESS